MGENLGAVNSFLAYMRLGWKLAWRNRMQFRKNARRNALMREFDGAIVSINVAKYEKYTRARSRYENTKHATSRI